MKELVLLIEELAGWMCLIVKNRWANLKSHNFRFNHQRIKHYDFKSYHKKRKQSSHSTYSGDQRKYLEYGNEVISSYIWKAYWYIKMP